MQVARPPSWIGQPRGWFCAEGVPEGLPEAAVDVGREGLQVFD